MRTTSVRRARSVEWFMFLHTLSPGALTAGLLCLYVVLAPSVKVLPLTEPYDAQRLFQEGLLLGVALWLVAMPRERRHWLKTFLMLPVRVRKVLRAVLLLGGASALLAPMPRYAVLEVGHLVLLFVLAVGVAGCYREARRVTDGMLVSAVALSAALYGVCFTVVYTVHVVDGSIPNWPHAFSGFSWVRLFNQYQTWTLPLLVLPPLVLPVRSAVVRRGLWLLPALWWCLLFASGGRGTLVAMAAAFLVVGVVFRREGAAWLRAQLATLAAGGGLYVLLFRVLTHGDASLAGRDMLNASGRFQLWDEALRMVTAHPFLGVGPMHYAYAPAAAGAAHPHNALLQWAAEWGIVSALLVLGLVVGGLYRWLRARRHEVGRTRDGGHRAVAVAVAAALVAGAVHALLSGLIVMPVSQVLMVLVVGWAWGLHVRRSYPWAQPKRRHALALCAIVLAALGVVGSMLYRDVPRLDERQEAYGRVAHEKVLRPRFWQQGYIGVEESSRRAETP